MKKEDHLQNLKRMIQNRSIQKRCYVCGEDDPRILTEFQKHHIFGQVHSEDTILLCLNCHGKITASQNIFPPKQRSSKASREDIIRFFLVTVGALLEIIAKKMQELGYAPWKNG